MTISRRIPNALFLTALCAVFCHAAHAADSPAAQIISKLPPTGFIVRTGSDDLALSAELAVTGRFTVLQYVTPEKVDALRTEALRLSVHGIVVIRPLPANGKTDLPSRFADIVLAEKPLLPDSELQRILNVEGKLLTPNGTSFTATPRKPEPGIDGWTHKWYGPTGNCVSQDSKSAPPQTIQWQAGPASTNGSYPAIDEGVFAVIDDAAGELHVRSAGNGILRFALPTKMNVNADLVINAGEILARPNEGLTTARGAPETGPLTAYKIADGSKTRTFNDAPTLPKAAGKDRPGIPCTLATPTHLIVSAGPDLAVLDRATGKRLWSAKLAEGLTWFSPRLLDGTLVAIECKVGANRGRIDGTSDVAAITAFDFADGKTLWRSEKLFQPNVPTGLPQYALKMNSLTLAAGKVFLYVSSYQANNPNGFLAALDLKTGSQTWRYAMPEGDVKPRWAATDSASYIFFRDQKLYYVGGHGWGGIATFNPETGKLATDFQRGPVNYFAYAGECSMSRATVNYFIKASTTWFDQELKPTIRPASRSHCGMGTFPAQGMSFVTPAACDCTSYSRAYQGFNSELVPAPVEDSARLLSGPASLPTTPQDSPSWSTFLANPQRNPVLPGALPDKLQLLRTVTITKPTPGPLLSDRASSDYWVGAITAPTINGTTAFVALPDAHALAAVDLASGKVKWTTPLGGPVDSPPTLYRGLAIAGSQDGRIYALRQDTGEIVWSFLAAPSARSAMLNGRLASAFPAPGSVTIAGDKLLVTAGYHSYLGGIYTWTLDPLTGKILNKSSTVGTDTKDSANNILNDNLTANAASTRFWVSDTLQLDTDGKPITVTGRNPQVSPSDRPTIRFERRSPIMTFTTPNGRGGATHGWPAPARASGTVGYRVLEDGPLTYELLDPSEGRASSGKVLGCTKITADAKARGEPVWTIAREQVKNWSALNSLIKVGNTLYVGGGSRDTSTGFLAIVNAADGKILQTIELPARTSSSGLAANANTLVVSLTNGQLLIFGNP